MHLLMNLEGCWIVKVSLGLGLSAHQDILAATRFRGVSSDCCSQSACLDIVGQKN